MGTTLTGTTPQDTYDSLIKVTDNGPLSGTAKYLSDGLGNDSKLALSTGNIGINTTTPDIFGRFYTYSLGIDSSGSTALQIDGTSYSTIDMGANGVRLGFLSQSATEISLGNLSTIPLTFQTNSAERMRITDTGNVGIGTSSPDGKLDVASAGNLVSTGAFTNPHLALTLTGSPVDNDSFVGITYATSDAANYGWSMGAKRESGGNGFLEIRQHFNSATGTQIARFTGNGLCFGSDTAAANALDDYEEGTFTPSVAFGGASVGITYFDRQGNYTKIGRQVTCTMYIALTAVGSSTGNATITGLPFTCANLNRGTVGAPSFRFANITFSGQLTGSVPNNNTIVELSNTTLLGVQTALTNANFNSASEFNAITVTYFTA